MTPQLIDLKEKTLIGMNSTMSFAGNTTPLLWKSFMPRRKEISNAVGANLYSLQTYAPGFFDAFDPNRTFEKWALVEVTDPENIPPGMNSFILPGGLYAVFHYKGDAKNAGELFQYILGEWLPASEYSLDQRPHFEVLGEKYKNNDPGSEEEIWIPIRKKQVKS